VGEAFNIGGGPANSLSLLELFAFLQRELDVELPITHLGWRPSDQRVYVSNISKASRLLDWSPRVGRDEGLRRMIEWAQSHG
jgi:CDP-paratose 2-epimerase